tara:strand:- start:446 stop:688 length:243 start_codon:yes stop_codon:yes gene_type:complete
VYVLERFEWYLEGPMKKVYLSSMHQRRAASEGVFVLRQCRHGVRLHGYESGERCQNVCSTFAALSPLAPLQAAASLQLNE